MKEVSPYFIISGHRRALWWDALGRYVRPVWYLLRRRRFTPILGRRRCSADKILGRQPEKRHLCALSAQIRSRGNGFFGAWESGFLRIGDSAWAPSFRSTSGYLKTHVGGGGTLSSGNYFCGNLDFPGKRKIEVPRLQSENGKSPSTQYAYRWKLSGRYEMRRKTTFVLNK